jgi:hypothetical protein
VNYQELSQRLNRAIAVTNFGDYLSALAYGLLLSKLNNNIAYFGYIWTFRSLAQALGATIAPTLLIHFNAVSILKNTQLFLGLVSVAIFFLFRHFFADFSFLSEFIIFSWLGMSILAQVFLSIKECYAKEIEKYIPSTERVELVSRIQTIRQEAGAFLGQSIGPLSFILLVYTLKIPVEYTILIDAATFIVAWVILLPLPNVATSVPSGLVNAIRVTANKSELISLFIVRGILIWISMGLLNFSLGPLAASNWQTDLKLAPLVYVAIGFGGLLFSWLVEKTVTPAFHYWFQSKSNSTHAIVSTLIYTSAVLTFSFSLNLVVSTIACVTLGFANGIQRVSLRQMTQRLCNVSEFHSFSSLLWTSGRVSDFLFTFLITKRLFPGASIQFFGNLSGLFILSCVPFFILVSFREKTLFNSVSTGENIAGI